MFKIKDQKLLTLKHMEKGLIFSAFSIIILFICLQSSPQILFIYSNIAQMIGPLICGVIYYYTSKYVQKPLQKSFKLMALAAVFWTLSQMIWMYNEVFLNKIEPFGDLGHVGYLLSYWLMSISIFRCISLKRIKKQHYKIVFDVAILIITIVSILWYFHGSFLISYSKTTNFMFLVVMIEPVLILDIITCILLLVYNYIENDENKINLDTFIYIILGLMCISIASLKFVFSITKTSYQTGVILDMLWPIGFIILSMAALAALSNPSPRDKPRQINFNTQALLNIIPYVIMLSVPSLIIINVFWPRDSASMLGIGICSIILLVLVAIRQFLMLNERDQMINQLENHSQELVISLAKALEAKSPYTEGHSERVANLSRKIAIRLNLEQEQIENLYQAALLHDIGKIGINDDILNKEGPLTLEEYNHIKQHPLLGVDILKPISQFKHIIPIICAHHERNDGSGYPFGLKEKEIPLEAKIISVADTFDAITSNRPYRDAQSNEYALQEIMRNTPDKLDSIIVKILEYILKKETINSANKILVDHIHESVGINESQEVFISLMQR